MTARTRRTRKTTPGVWPAIRVLRDRNAGLCLAGVVVSGFGTSALWLASGVWVKDLTGSDGLAALCMLALWAPALLGPALGTLADRVRHKPLLIAVNLLPAVLLLALFTVDSPDALWLLFAVLFVYGAAGVVHDAAESALVAEAVDPRLLGDFNGLRTTAGEGMKLVAPPAGAAVYAGYGGASVAALDAVTFVLATGVYAALRVREEPPRRPTANWRRRTAEGARYLWARPRLRPLVLAGGVMMLCAGVSGATLYAVVDSLGRSPAYAGVLYAVQGADSVLIGLLAGPGLRRLGERRFAAAGLTLLAMAVAARAVPNEAVAMASGAAAGVGMPAVLIAALTAVQHETPGPLLGRVTATAHSLIFTPNVLGLAWGAALVELADLRVLLPALGTVLLVAAVALARRPASAAVAPGSPPATGPT
ncbi:Integral membrane efflux protein [Streptomyces ambofaciens ATCC 23877]|uniref:Integral membrane efflux protein n=1 Tax=Streptomyces ambofaciens (strain ATCC 23877 / 3486 / DSM 40053 / JCM 4204 / NBRC 12836 / NRRL B-2516) TaxID=278992 RepID=A0A0K2AQ39_STRA7|nr:MFS transporter [Streptomyces ambofaciens]AKZ55016.1 Integral membrane efflux protein [Streptomyces ambofaciens ATCC 23877]